MPINASVLKNLAQQNQITKATIALNSPTQSYQYLVDTINRASTLKKLPYTIKGVPSGNIDALTFGTRNLRLHDKTFNSVPAGTDNTTDRPIPFAVKKCDFDIWIDNDDMYYYAAREALNMKQQPDISNPANLQALIISAEQKMLAMDMQDLMFNGDTEYPTAGTDKDFVTILDGFVKKMLKSTNKKDITTAEMTLANLLEVVTLLPEKYKSNFGEEITWFMNQSSHDKILGLLMARTTNFGDAIIQEGKVTRLFGYNVEVVAGMVGPLKTPADATSARQGAIFLTPLSNLVPVSTKNPSINYRSVGPDTDVIAAKKDATYHIWNVYLDAILREVDAVSYMIGDKA